jgi:hypothetical protein
MRSSDIDEYAVDALPSTGNSISRHDLGVRREIGFVLLRRIASTVFALAQGNYGSRTGSFRFNTTV